jgi:hypothetical protein
MRPPHENHIPSRLGEGALQQTAFFPNPVEARGAASGAAPTTLEEMIMRTIVGALIGLSLLVGAAASASAADCKVTGWIDSGQGGHPIYSCPDQSN